ncbi:aminotransferase class V-fold PLP-dependent enzyme [Streptosporangium sp. NPDC003464]
MNVQIESYLARFSEPPGYLDFARIGPTSHDVATTLIEAARLLRGDSSIALAELELQAARTRAGAARLLRAAEHEVAFVSSTSHGLFAAAAALQAPGRGSVEDAGVVLVPRGEFPSNVYPWLRFEGRGGLRVRWIDSPRITPDVVAAHLDGDVRALSISAVDALTGYRAPLGALKELLGPDRVLVVDAIQGLGAVPIEVDAADLLVCGGQKWLRAGWGAALLLVRDRVDGRLVPGLGGWSGVQDPFGTGEDVPVPDSPARALAATDGPGHGPAGGDGAAHPGGTVAHPRPPLRGAIAHTLTNPDYPAVAALGAAIDLVLGVGVAEIGRRVTETLGALLDTARGAGAQILLDDLDAAERGGIGCFRLPGLEPAAVHTALAGAGLVTTLRGGWIRFSPHATTPHETTQRLVSALRAARASEPPPPSSTALTPLKGTAK